MYVGITLLGTSFNHMRRFIHLFQRNIKPTVPLTGFRSCLHFICGPPNLSNEMIEDRDLIFALAACMSICSPRMTPIELTSIILFIPRRKSYVRTAHLWLAIWIRPLSSANFFLDSRYSLRSSRGINDVHISGLS